MPRQETTFSIPGLSSGVIITPDGLVLPSAIGV